MKILSNKKYASIVGQNDKLTKQILKQIHEINSLKNQMVSVDTLLYTTKAEVISLKLENKRLKTILTKNKIEYKKENKKENVGKCKKKK